MPEDVDQLKPACRLEQEDCSQKIAMPSSIVRFRVPKEGYIDEPSHSPLVEHD